MSEQTYRVIFEFTDVEQVETFLQHISEKVEVGELTLGGSWSWGAETTQTMTFGES